MNSQIRHRQAQQFDTNFQMLEISINRIQRRNRRMRNFFLLLLTQVLLLSFFAITSWTN